MPVVDQMVASVSDEDFDRVQKERAKNPAKQPHPERARYRLALLSQYAPAFMQDDFRTASDTAHLAGQPTTLEGLTPSAARGILAAQKAGLFSGTDARQEVWAASISRVWAAVVHTSKLP